jgi:monothiol glutaredoxin
VPLPAEESIAMKHTKPNPFRIATPETAGETGRPVPVTGDARPALDRVDSMVRSADIFVFLKGTPEQPMCGFSANTVAMLDSVGARYVSFDVLSDESIRSAAKDYAQWPTFPQVWVRGELVGGNDIVAELHASGELARLVGGVR